MSLIIPTLVYIAEKKSLPPPAPPIGEDGKIGVEAAALADVRALPSFSATSISYLSDLAFEPIEEYYESVRNRVKEYDFSKLRLWIVYENIISDYEPSLSEELRELRMKIKDYLSVPVIEINVFALVKNRVRLGSPLQVALQKAAREHLIDYVFLLNNSNLSWVNAGNILRLSENEFYKYGLRMIEYIHFANIMLDDIAFSFNSLQKRRFYFTISSSFDNFSSNGSQPPKKETVAETNRFPDVVRDCLQSFFTNSFAVLRKTKQTDVFGFLQHPHVRNEARQVIFQGLQAEGKTRDDLLNAIYKKFQPKDFKKIEQTFTLLILLSIFQTGLLDQFQEIRDYLASSNNLERAKKLLPRIVSARVTNNIRELCDEKLHSLRLDEERLEAAAWSEQTDNLWKPQIDRKKHPQQRRIFEKNLKIIKDPTESILSVGSSAHFSPMLAIEYKDGVNGLGARPADLIPALKHILKMVLKNAFENSYSTIKDGFLLLDKPRIEQAESMSDLNEADAICRQIEKLKNFLQVEDIDKNKFLKESHSKFEELVAYNLIQSGKSSYTPEIMARQIADLLCDALNNSRRHKSAPVQKIPDKILEELPAFFSAPSSLSKGLSPVLSVIFTGEKLALMNDAVLFVQNIDYRDQKISLFGPWNEHTCFEE